jgi:hypothetical protein
MSKTLCRWYVTGDQFQVIIPNGYVVAADGERPS